MIWTCHKCKTENKPTFRFCFGCGAPRSADSAPSDRPPAEIRPPAPATTAVPPIRNKIGTEPQPLAAPRPAGTDEPGWRCHQCWKLNPKDATVCSECGTGHAASDRADLKDKVFGGFGRVGEWPYVVLSVIAVIGVIGFLFYYLNPKHGDVIDAPAGLEAEITASLDEVSKRLPEQSVYYNCFSTTVDGRTESGGYAVLVRLVPRSQNVANRGAESSGDPDRFWQFIAHRDGYKWKVERFRVAGFENVADPCSTR